MTEIDTATLRNDQPLPASSGAIAILSRARAMVDDMRVLDLTKMDDESVALFVDMAKQARADVSDEFKAIETAGKNELLTRMQKIDARAIPSTAFAAIERVDDYTSYAFDLDCLKQAAALLPPDEAAKVVKHVPEYTPPVVPAHDEPGNPVSITALIKKYGEQSAVGTLLKRGMKRDKVGESVVIKPLKVTAPSAAPKSTTLEVIDGGRA